MKFTLATLPLFVLSTLVTALPTEDTTGWETSSYDEALNSGLPFVDLEVTDPRFPGQTFSGSAQSIYEEMVTQKPELFVNDTLIAAPSSDDDGSISKRQSFNCGWGNNGGHLNNCVEGVGYLMNLGTAWCGVNAAPACARVSCSHQCGIFLCNKQNSHLQVYCGDIAKDVNKISNNCPSATGAFAGAMDFASHFTGVSQRQGC